MKPVPDGGREGREMFQVSKSNETQDAPEDVGVDPSMKSFQSCVRTTTGGSDDMVKVLGRFIKRGKDGEKDRVAVLDLFPAGQEYFQQDMVYEIVEILGEVLVRPRGKTWMDRRQWNRNISEVITQYNACLTVAEIDYLLSLDEQARREVASQFDPEKRRFFEEFMWAVEQSRESGC